MKVVNVDEVLKILYKYDRYIFVTDENRYSSMVDEIANLRALEQESVLDKIRAEIEKTTSRYTISRERGAMGQVEWSDRLIKESEVLQIIDKYKAESEDI